MISGKTKLLCVLGSPIAHSLSPAMHNEACRILDLDYSYMAFDITPDKLEKTVEGLVALGARGWNLTMPLKIGMVPLCDKLSDASKLSGAVNTVVNDNGYLTGHTTDGVGFMRVLTDNNVSIKGNTFTMLGAGGAAGAIVVQAALDGAKTINMFKRKNASWDKTAEFIGKISAETGCDIVLKDIADDSLLKKDIADSDALINATNVGMAPDIDGTPVKKELLCRDTPVFDIIYNPRETRLMREASEIGAVSANGLYMLLYQGAESFRLWTDKEMPVEDIRKKYFS